MKLRPFPPDFLWGTATSSHQVEGDNVNSDWWAWEQEPGRIYDGSRSGKAAGWWDGSAESDLAQAAHMGQNAHRMSLEWSRLEPAPGQFDLAAFARYREILHAAREHGMRTMVTLHHFTLPQWAASEGSWLWRDLPRHFAAFAVTCLKRLGDLVDLWVTINEPAVLALSAYVNGRWPPGHTSIRTGMKALANLLVAHSQAYRAMHEEASPPEGPGHTVSARDRVTAEGALRVGIVINNPFFEAANPCRLADRGAAALQDWSFNGAPLAALTRGWLLPPIVPLARPVAGMAHSFDFIGLNYYGRYQVQFDPSSPMIGGRHVQQPTTRTEWNDWGQPCARGLEAQLMRLRPLGIPIYVTENGLYDPDDDRRPGFLLDHLHAVANAIYAGVDVRGYFHWSLIDNFEWAEGWATPFGLIALDRESGRRTVRRSGRIYAAICQAGGIPEELEL